jgi:hypothetical protein
MLLLASAPNHALHRNDLGCSGKLQFKVHAREMGKEQLQLLDFDLRLFVGHNTTAAGPLSNGHQTMVIAGVYTVSRWQRWQWASSTGCCLQDAFRFQETHQKLFTSSSNWFHGPPCYLWCGALSCAAMLAYVAVGLFNSMLELGAHAHRVHVTCTYVFVLCLQNPQGWTLSFDCSTFPEDSWGLLLPQLRSLLQRWPTLSAADNARKLPAQTVVCSRKGEDHALPVLAAKLWPQPKAAKAAAAAAEDAANADSGSAEAAEAAGEQEATRGSLDNSVAAAADGTAAAAAAAAGAAAAISVDRLVLELGWEVFKPKAAGDDEEEEEEEPPVVDFSLTLYNLQVRLCAPTRLLVVLSLQYRAL